MKGSGKAAPTLTDRATGKRYFESFQKELEETKERSTRALRRKLGLTAQNLFGLCDELIDETIEEAIDLLSEAQGLETLAAYNRLRPLCHALFYADINNKIYSADIIAKAGEELAGKIKQGRALQKKGHHWLGVLADCGVVTRKLYESILEGDGDADTAGDLQQMSEILDKNFTAIALTAPNHPDPEIKMTRSDVLEMAEIGTELVELIRRSGGDIPEGEIDWSDQIQGLYALLEHDYHLVRAALAYLFDLQQRKEEAWLLISLWAMGSEPWGSRKPTASKKKQGDGEKKPGDDEKKPGDDEKKPGDDEDRPVDEEAKEPGD